MNNSPAVRRRLSPLLFVGIALVAAGVWNIVGVEESPTDRLDTLRQPVFVTATVVDWRFIGGGVRNQLCELKVSFTTSDARPTSARTEGSENHICRYQPGQNIPVAYEASDPTTIVAPVSPDSGGVNYFAWALVVAGGALAASAVRGRMRSVPNS